MSTTEIPLNNLGPPTQDSDQASREPLLSILSPTPSVSCRSSARSAAANDEDEAHRRFFRDSSSPPPGGSAFTTTGVETKSTGVSAVIPEKTLTFKFTAEFEGCEPGQYVVQWRVSFLENLSIPSGLRLSVNVSYDAEPMNTTGSLDVIMSSESLQDAVRGGKYDLRLEELVVIQPHKGHARVELALFNNDSIKRSENSGLQVDFVQLRPIAIAYERPSDVREYVLEKPAKSTFNIEAKESLAYALGTPLDTLPTLSLTRLAWSNDGCFLAALALSKKAVYIIVWNLNHINGPSSPSADIPGLHQNCIIGTVEHQDIDKLSIGLAISEQGDQVVVYEEPKVGQWKEGSKLDKCEFQLRHFYNPLVPQKQVVVNMSQKSGKGVKHQGTGSDGIATAGPQSQSGNTSRRLELQDDLPHRMLERFIGYGTFLTRTGSNGWMENGQDASQLSSVGVEDCGANDGEEEGSSGDNKHTGGSKDSMIWTFFAACNGIYIDVFEISLERKWTHIHAIQLTDLVPTLNWRATCLMMVETMTSDTFIWLEDDGCCSIWDLHSGSNITYISCKKNTTFYDTNIPEAIRMAISPDESIVASADSDGTLTTYYTRTGIEIDQRKFPGHKIEYVGFHGQNNQLLVIVRATANLNLSSKVLDPLLLGSETTAKTIPVPMIGTTVFAYSGKKGFQNRGLVCEVGGNRIRCHVSHESDDSETTLDESTLVDTNTRVCRSPRSGDINGQMYGIRTRTYKDSMHWVISVEVFEESSGQASEKIIFSFVPEPWTRLSTEGDTHPENLHSAYFLPGESRFVVTGIHTLQIWDLPKDDNDSCSLVFIWSQPIPRDDAIFIAQGKGSGCVEDYYHKIERSTIYLDQNSGNVVADIGLMHVTDTIQVHIPRLGCSNDPLVFRHCFRSVHLLAATYACCLKEIKMTSRDSVQRTISFEKHADSIIRSTRDHINRVLFVKRRSQTGKEATTLLMLLVGRPDLKDSNHVFIEGLLNTTLDEWVPHPNKSLSPIAFAISTKDEQLLKILTTYCIKCAKAYHPAYLFPVDQCLDELLDRFPDILADIFRKTSYIPAQEQTFPLSRVQVANFTYFDVYRYIIFVIALVFGIFITMMDPSLVLSIVIGWILLTLIHPSQRPSRLLLQQRVRYVVHLITFIIGIALIWCAFLVAPSATMVWIPQALIHPATALRFPRLYAQKWLRYIIFLIAIIVSAFFLLTHIFVFLALFHPSVIQQLWCFFSKESSLNTNYYGRRVFTLRPQLPFFSSKTPFVYKVLPLWMQVSEFPSMQTTAGRTISSRDICVSPFRLLPVRRDSAFRTIFSKISGTNFFDSPAVVMSLQLKWYTFGFRYWLGRFIPVLAYFVLVMVITAHNIHESLRVSSLWRRGERPTTYDVYELDTLVYLGAFMTGVFLLCYEFMQFLYRASKYLSSPFNYIRLTAFILSFIGCFRYMNDPSLDTPTQSDKSYLGPSEFPFMSFAILLIYITMVSASQTVYSYYCDDQFLGFGPATHYLPPFQIEQLLELQAIRPLGIAVNIISNMARRISWYFLIFFFILVAFTHSLLYTLHSRQYKSCEGEACENSDNPSLYPTDFGRALSATIFFLSGRYDPVDKSFIWGSKEFHVLMAIFYFFTAFLFINLLIGMEVISALIRRTSTVLKLRYSRRRYIYNYPGLVYYHATEEEVEKYWSKYSVSEVSNLSAEDRFVVETSSANHHTIMNDIKALAEDVKIDRSDRARSHHETKQEIAEAKQEIAEAKQEIVELKQLIVSLLRKLDDKNARPNNEQ
ncbi:MAG: hypothetical protein J3Q66DRAFT_419865 [Benniella sp.]|nr:MAG: hypothetical protein J3Q66DRAFT_419865 [Benniella sp.]